MGAMATMPSPSSEVPEATERPGPATAGVARPQVVAHETPVRPGGGVFARLWRLLESVGQRDTRGQGTVPATAAAALLCGVVGLAFILLYGLQFGWTSETIEVIATGVLIAGGAFMTGAALGFLFAIPKIRQGDEVVIAANTNLEQISDWLTKILVGVGLIQFREIGSALEALGDNLAESLGGGSSADTMGLAICVYFATGGFLAGYLLTRLLLPAAFRSVEGDLAARVADLEANVQEQDLLNTRALSLYSHQVDVGRRTDPPSQQTLNDAIAKAAAVVKLVIFQQARDLRRRSWESDEPSSTSTIPIFRALIASDDGTNFEYHGQLGYALKDQEPPAWSDAERELTVAIAVRDKRGLTGWVTYELNRAECRAALNAPEEGVRRDLAAAASDEDLRRAMSGYPQIARWLQEHEVTLERFLEGGLPRDTGVGVAGE